MEYGIVLGTAACAFGTAWYLANKSFKKVITNIHMLHDQVDSGFLYVRQTPSTIVPVAMPVVAAIPTTVAEIPPSASVASDAVAVATTLACPDPGDDCRAPTDSGAEEGVGAADEVPPRLTNGAVPVLTPPPDLVDQVLRCLHDGGPTDVLREAPVADLLVVDMRSPARLRALIERFAPPRITVLRPARGQEAAPVDRATALEPGDEGDGCLSRLASNAYDLVICDGDPHLATPPADMLNTLRRLLRRGGTAVLSVANEDSIWHHLYAAWFRHRMVVTEPLALLPRRAWLERRTVANSYRRGDFHELAGRYGFAVVDRGGCLSAIEASVLPYRDLAMDDEFLEPRRAAFLRDVVTDGRTFATSGGHWAGFCSVYELTRE